MILSEKKTTCKQWVFIEEFCGLVNDLIKANQMNISVV